MNLNLKHNHWYWFLLLLTAEMVLLYPAHVIIDHSGLIDHHHENDRDHTENGFQDEEICIFCVNLGSMEDSKSVLLNSADQKDVHYSFEKSADKAGLEQGNSVRAPPSLFLI